MMDNFVNYIKVNGQKLSYSEVNNEKNQTILFLNGNSHSRKSFHRQLSDKKFDNYRLIALDLPGHGDSSSLDNYTLICLATIVEQFIKKLNINELVLVGHSLGGHVALHLLNSVSPLGVVIFGTPPLSKPFNVNSFLANEAAIPLGLESCTDEQLEILSSELKYNPQDAEQFAIDYHKADKNFRSQIFKSVENDLYFDEVDLLTSYSGKLLAFICLDDKIINNEYVIQSIINNPSFKLKKSSTGHSPQLERADKFNEDLLGFVHDVFIVNNRKYNPKISDYINYHTV